MQLDNMADMLKGRTLEQQEVIKYFYQKYEGFTANISDEEYESMIQRKVNASNFKQRALSKISLDESQLQELEPVCFENFVFDHKDSMIFKGEDGLWRTSKYQISWIFFGEDTFYMYQYTFDMATDMEKESIEEYFYQDITNFSISFDSVEKEIIDKLNCKDENTNKCTSIDYNRFVMIVPGERIYGAMILTDYTKSAIQSMKTKLREKKLYVF